MLKKIIRHFNQSVWKLNRKRLNQNNQNRLSEKGKTVSIISMNCTGGVLYHDLSLEFRSPTINLFMRAGDFIKFCENLEYYLSIDEMQECRDENVIEERKYPIAYLGDLTLFLVHYSSVSEAQKKWNERKKRINWENIVILNTDREGMTDELKERFERLPYRRVMFTHLPDEKHTHSFYIKGYEAQECVGIITESIGIKGKRMIDQFDYVEFFNEDE